MEKLRELLELVDETSPRSGLSDQEAEELKVSIQEALKMGFLKTSGSIKDNLFSLTDKGYSTLLLMRGNEYAEKMRSSSKRLNFATGILVVLTAALLGATFFVFYIERDIERQSFISDMESLLIEIDKNVEIIDRLFDFLKMNETKLFQYVYLTGNMENLISDGRVRNETVKTRIIVRYHDIKQLGKILEITNSPEFVLIGEETWEKRKIGYENKTLADLVNKVKPDLENDRELIGNYVMCLKSAFDTATC
ncbi:MAG: hypothetical protein ABIN18_22340 [Pseudomonadota bacterium]